MNIYLTKEKFCKPFLDDTNILKMPTRPLRHTFKADKYIQHSEDEEVLNKHVSSSCKYFKTPRLRIDVAPATFGFAVSRACNVNNNIVS